MDELASYGRKFAQETSYYKITGSNPCNLCLAEATDLSRDCK